MMAISIRQPWAWLIVRPDLHDDDRLAAAFEGELKDIENRGWSTNYRGPLLLHAAKGMTRDEYEDAQDPLWSVGGPTIELPPMSELQRGGIIGKATLVDCVPPHQRESWWHLEGCYGFKLCNVQPLPFRPLRGALRLFDVPDGFASQQETVYE
ncbi:MAG: hypothetical protein EPN79_02110 [Burkholderiaceae bacterium]|nr:MAG: hypothetical protein EPN79_02110 [Burkholderiaceae bacterium]TBR76168.1 MAG: hypothetical protein EPN64_09165 [Burkholderiaceae bacterium]